MAKGKNCPYCKKIMYIENEKRHPAGSDVVYYCNNCNFKERIFEGKSKECPNCKYYMYGYVERVNVFSTQMAYQCPKCNFKEKITEQ
jgi:RNase P subunit RPR2